eukprot:symbB.v1.2.019103.t3/scaffold1548.1/size117880/8
MMKSYNNLQKLGSGAFGAVFKAQCRLTHEWRAIKKLPLSDVADDMAFVYAELEAMIHLHHPNVVKFYEHFEQENALFMVTELCDGGDFSELNHGIDDPQEVKLLIRDVVMALAYCHDHGVAHRDLKFENCLIKNSYKNHRVGKVIDFGLSAIRTQGQGEGHRWMFQLHPSDATARAQRRLMSLRFPTPLRPIATSPLRPRQRCCTAPMVTLAGGVLAGVKPMWRRFAHVQLRGSMPVEDILFCKIHFSSVLKRTNEDPTTALHQKYHDGTLQYTMDNMEWVEKRGFSKDDHLTEQQKSKLRHGARQRLCRWPRLLPEDAERIQHTASQQFGPGREKSGADQVFQLIHLGGTGAALGDPEEHVFIVSLARRPEKRSRVLRQLEEHQLNATVVNAMDGDGVLYQDDLAALGVRILPGYNSGFSNHNMPYTTGEVGCFLSHYAVWHRMVEQNIPAALILEDDFDLQANFKHRLGEYLSEAEGLDWNLMYVGRSPMENDVSVVSDHVVEPGYTLWTVGYILRLDAAKALLETEAHQHMIPLDDFFSISMGCGMDGQYNERISQKVLAGARPSSWIPDAKAPFQSTRFKREEPGSFEAQVFLLTKCVFGCLVGPGDEEHTFLNEQLGTRFFVAPEVIDKSIPYGCKCDCWSLGVMLYIIMTDEHPCCPDAHKMETPTLFGKILTGRVRQRPLQDAGLDYDACQLLMGLLEKNPAARMDAQGALRSKWLANIKDVRPRTPSHKLDNINTDATSPNSSKSMKSPISPLTHGTIRRLAAFRHYSKFERAVLTLVAHRSEEQHIAELRETFHLLDTSKTGSLSKSEIREGIRLCGHQMKEDELNEIFSALDADGTGKVHYTEWLAATMKPSTLATDTAIKQVFHYLDIDQTGLIKPHELFRVLGCSDTVKTVLDAADADGDSVINEEEFRALMRNMAKRLDKFEVFFDFPCAGSAEKHSCAAALFSYRRASRAPGQWSFGGDEWLPQEEELFFGVVSRDFCAEKGLGLQLVLAHSQLHSDTCDAIAYTPSPLSTGIGLATPLKGVQVYRSVKVFFTSLAPFPSKAK